MVFHILIFSFPFPLFDLKRVLPGQEIIVPCHTIWGGKNIKIHACPTVSFANLDVKGSTTEFSTTLVVKDHPGFVFIEASTFPSEIVFQRRSGADEDGEKIHRAVEAVEDGPRELSGKQRKHVSRMKSPFQGPNLRAR